MNEPFFSDDDDQAANAYSTAYSHFKLMAAFGGDEDITGEEIRRIGNSGLAATIVLKDAFSELMGIYIDSINLCFKQIEIVRIMEQELRRRDRSG